MLRELCVKSFRYAEDTKSDCGFTARCKILRSKEKVKEWSDDWPLITDY